jgi:DNA (cytosine-5)-methyltransferase 1
MRHGSLFSGIGGFDLASEWMGWENVFHCEWMEFPRKVLDYYWPNADSHIDICKTDFKKYANKIDILTGGFPCQPFSMAGKRKGTEDERYLWGEMLRAIQEIKPKYVIAENVFGITNIDGGLVFEQVCLDLETEGYEVQPFIIPAVSKNAPHRRDRVWFIAQNTLLSRCLHGESKQERTKIWEQRNTCTRSADGIYLQKGNIANSDGIRQELPKKGHRPKNNKSFKPFKQLHKFQPKGWDKFPIESPICGGDDGLPTQLDGITISKWRAESIKGYGNAIVPQVAYEIFKQLKIHITDNQ